MRSSLVVLILILLSQQYAYAYSVDDALESARQHKQQVNDSSKINERLLQPAMSDKSKFKTFDGQQEFQANLMCSGEGPVIRVTAFPVGSIAGVGELNIKVEYDENLDGTLEGVISLNNVGGMCGNGLVKECKPSGSWSGCRYCKWAVVDDRIQEQCEYGTGDSSPVPVGPQGLKGCFCFNASCGSPTLDMLETILSFAAKGVLDVLQQRNNLMVITKSEYKPESLQLSYMGAKAANCSASGSDSKVSELISLSGKINFPTDAAVDEAMADTNSPYSAVAATFSNDSRSQYKCQMTSKVGVELQKVNRVANVDFGIGVDADGGSKQCFWARGGYCGAVFGETGDYNTCANRIVPAGLSDICNTLLVNGGVFVDITGVSEYKPTSGMRNYFGCYGADNDAGDQLWEMKCSGTRLDDVFVCNSPSMSIPKQIIKNAPYNEALYQGCEEVLPPKSTCDTLEARRQEGECELVSEITDGVYTYREGANTGLSSSGGCKTFSGSRRSITVCEPWWTKDRVYRCSDFDDSFSKEKQRAQYVGGSIGYDETTGKWSSQGDLVWQGDSKLTSVFDPSIEFQKSAKTCVPACRIETDAKKTDLHVPTQGKLASDGSYHLPYDGELTYTTDQDTVVQDMRECVESGTGEWSCPLLAGERAVTGCECFDQDAFGQAVATLQAINLASTNMICSSGNVQGVCTPEDEGLTAERVMCGKFSYNEDGTVDIEKSTIWDCEPKLWKGAAVAAQTHTVAANEEYKCVAKAVGYPEDDHFDNVVWTLSPVPAWFKPAVDWAKPYIIDLLQNDGRFIPSPGADCPCSADGEGCKWTLASSVESINEDYQLGLAPGALEPFGYVRLALTTSGVWGKTTSAACVQEAVKDEAVEITINGTCSSTSGWGAKTCWYDYDHSYVLGVAPLNGYDMWSFYFNDSFIGDAESSSSSIITSGFRYTVGSYQDRICIRRHPDKDHICIISRNSYQVCRESQQAGYSCSISSGQYITSASCTAACSKKQYQCKESKIIVDSPNDCPDITAFKCPLDDKRYSSLGACESGCKKTENCQGQGTSFEFQVAIENSGGNGFEQALQQVSPDARSLAREMYAHKDIILSQCVDHYTQPYIGFEDPATKARFSFAQADLLAYQVAAERGELPRDDSSGVKWSLPNYPPVFRATYTYTESDPPVRATVPNSPMFWDAMKQASWVDDGASKLGTYTVSLSNLIPYVYYWQCPQGNLAKGSTNSCGATPPTGGVDSTIDGKWCFQYRCDVTGTMEPNHNYSGCGMVNDGEWQ